MSDYPSGNTGFGRRVLRLLSLGAGVSMPTCKDIAEIKEVKQPERRECSECVKTSSRWVHLRTCQTCGVTLCCDSSPNTHASKHARASGHPVIASAERGEHWLYCYPDDVFAEY